MSELSTRRTERKPMKKKPTQRKPIPVERRPTRDPLMPEFLKTVIVKTTSPKGETA